MRSFSLPPFFLNTRYEPGNHLIKYIWEHWRFLSWVLMLTLVNWPILYGEVRLEMMFLPDAVKNGQWWRLVTFPLVHLSWYHLLLDAGGFLLVFRSLEEKRPAMKCFYAVSAGMGSLLLALTLEPSISQRGLAGLSGIAHGLMAISGLEMLRYPVQRYWGIFSLILVVGKSAYELYMGQVMFQFMHMGLCGYPVAACHAGGVIGGVLAFITARIILKDDY